MTFKRLYIFIAALILGIAVFIKIYGPSLSEALDKDELHTNAQNSIPGPPNISPPSTLWTDKTITISGITRTYRFGEGNPSDLQIATEDRGKYMSTQLSDGSFPDGYVTPKIELALKTFLNNPRLPFIIDKCYQHMNWYVPDYVPSWERFPHDLSLERMLFVNSTTGRKELREQDLLTMLRIFDTMSNSFTGTEPWKKCLSGSEMKTQFTPLYMQLSDVVGSYHSAR